MAGPTSAGRPRPTAYKQACVNGYCFQNGEPITVWRNPNTSSGVRRQSVQPSYAYRLMPKHVSGKSVDVAYGSTNNGTAVQQWATNTNTRRSSPSSPSGSNWKIAMKINTNKCFGPAGNGTGELHRDRDPGLQRRPTQAWNVTLVSGTGDTFTLQERGGEPLPGGPGRQHGGWRPTADL